MTAADTQRLCDVVLDETIGRATPDVEHERAVAIFDLIEENSFEPAGHDKGSRKSTWLPEKIESIGSERLDYIMRENVNESVSEETVEVVIKNDDDDDDDDDDGGGR